MIYFEHVHFEFVNAMVSYQDCYLNEVYHSAKESETHTKCCVINIDVSANGIVT